MHICVGKLTSIGSDNSLSPGQCQAIICTNAGLLVIEPIGTKLQWNFNLNPNIFIAKTTFENIICKMLAILSRPQCVNSWKPRDAYTCQWTVLSSLSYPPAQRSWRVINPAQRSWRGGILVSSCQSVPSSVRPSVDRIVSALYLLQYSLDPFHIYTPNQAISEGVSCVKFFSKFKNLKFGQIL